MTKKKTYEAESPLPPMPMGNLSCTLPGLLPGRALSERLAPYGVIHQEEIIMPDMEKGLAGVTDALDRIEVEKRRRKQKAERAQ